MIIYLALLIPILTAFVLYKFFAHKTVWWEFCIPFACSAIFIVLMKWGVEAYEVSCKEYWGSFIERVEYYEDWDEWVTETCTRSCCCDSKGENCGIETYDCSHSVYHPPIYQIITTTGEYVDIDYATYLNLKIKLGNETFIDKHRDYYTDDGDEYISKWTHDSTTAIPVTTTHHYENRIKVANQSIFHFEDVTEADKKFYGLYDYPPITGYYDMKAVLGDNSPDGLMADKKLQFVNGMLGHNKQVRAFILVFKNQPIEAALYQEWLWSGANMNEFVVCVGVDALRNVKWCKAISWTPSELLKVEVRNFVQEQKKLNLSATAGFMLGKIDKEWQRRDFKEFSYLTVEPPTWCVVLTFVLTLLINFGLSWWIVSNEFDE